MGTTTTITAPAAPTAQQLAAKLTVDEANQLVAAVTPSLSALATGDGSGTALLGQWIALQGSFVANASIFQKIGVNDGASFLLALVQQLPTLVAKATATPSLTPSLTPAPTPAPAS